MYEKYQYEIEQIINSIADLEHHLVSYYGVKMANEEYGWAMDKIYFAKQSLRGLRNPKFTQALETLTKQNKT